METYLSAQSPFRKLNFGNSSQKTCKSKYQTFIVLSSFTVSNILLEAVAARDALNTKDTEIESKIPDTTAFITPPEFNTLTKTSFDARMKEATKSLACDFKEMLLLIYSNR